MKYIIYQHLNKINGKSYIGQTIQEPKRRWKSGTSYKDQIFGKAIQKYGWENFEHIILKDNIQTVEEANYWEEYYIKKFHTYVYDKQCNGYNVSPGGYNRDNYGKTVLQLDIDKNIINEYVSICAAARAVDAPPDRISRCCNHPETAHEANGYFWCFKENYDDFIPIKVTKIPVYQLDENKNIINKFESIAEAGRAMGLLQNHNNISLCLTGKKCSAYGYYWCYVKDYDTYVIKKSPVLRKVYCIDLDRVFKNATEAAKTVGVSSTVIGQCCKGRQKTAAGYRWRYEDEKGKDKN